MSAPHDPDSPSSPDADTLAHVVRTLSTGVAVARSSDWAVTFENASFFNWFPPNDDADEPLTRRIPGLKPDSALARLADGRTFSFETEAPAGGRKVPIGVELRTLGEASAGQLVVECRDLSKQKQAEYMLESYSQMSERNARELQREKERAEKLLLNVMPRSVYEEMREYGTVTPQLFQDVTILMLDFVGSTEMAVSRDPVSLISQLNDMFMVFDRIAEQFGCERIRTVGDAYMAVSGLPEPTPEHAQNVARLALRMLRYIERRNLAHPEPWECRIGVNSGAVIGSLVGIQKYVYDIFGPGVNLAARMESLSEPMRITVSEHTEPLLRDHFQLTDRGEFEVKGFDSVRLFFLERELPHAR